LEARYSKKGFGSTKFFLCWCKKAMALTLLKRSDANMVLAAATDDPVALAECLSAQQPFEVHVFATFPELGWALPALQQSLRTLHISNGWFAAAPQDVAKTLCDASVPPNRKPCENECMCQNDTQTDTEDNGSESGSGSFEPEWHQLLQPCPKEHAHRATVIRKALKARLGNWQAAALLSNYREATLRLPGKGCQRFIVDCRGDAMRLAFEGAGGQIALAA